MLGAHRGKVALRARSYVAKRSSRASRLSKTKHIETVVANNDVERFLVEAFINVYDVDRMMWEVSYCVHGLLYATPKMRIASFLETVVPIWKIVQCGLLEDHKMHLHRRERYCVGQECTNVGHLFVQATKVCTLAPSIVSICYSIFFLCT